MSARKKPVSERLAEQSQQRFELRTIQAPGAFVRDLWWKIGIPILTQAQIEDPFR